MTCFCLSIALNFPTLQMIPLIMNLVKIMIRQSIYLKIQYRKTIHWFQCNNFKANASKCHFFLSPYKPITIKTKRSAIESSNSEKLLGVTIDSKLSFDDRITILCRKISQKLHALSRVASHMSFNKKRILLKTFITS